MCWSGAAYCIYSDLNQITELLHTRNASQSITISHNISSGVGFFFPEGSDVSSQSDAKTSLRGSTLGGKGTDSLKSLSISVKKEKWQNVCSASHSNQCSSRVAKGAAAMTSGPFCHEQGDGDKFKN